ncbi:MAG: tetratricopeptide repeat protein, partial [Myxococcota bacterium]
MRLVETYEGMVEKAEEPSERVERLVAIRSIYEERLDRPDEAFRAAGRAFDEAPDQPDTLEALERLGRQCGAVDELMTMLQTRADSLDLEHPARAVLRARLADHAENLIGDPRRAIEIWQQAHRDQPRNSGPLNELDRLFAQAGEAREQVAVRKSLAELADTPQARADHLIMAAHILEERLSDRPAAAFQYEQVLVQVPNHDMALDRLDHLYTESRADLDLGRILEVASRNRLGARRADAFYRLGKLKQGPLEDPRGAVDAYGEVLRMDPNDVGDAWPDSLNALDALMHELQGPRPELAAEAGLRLERHWAARDEPLKLVAAKQARVAGTSDPTTRKRLLLEVADIHERRLEQPQMAFQALAKAYGSFPDDAGLVDALDRVATSASMNKELADLLAQSVPSISDTEMALQVARRAAHIYEHDIELPDAAIGMHNRILALAPDDALALTALERLYQQTDDAYGLLTAYRGLLRLAQDDEAQSGEYWRRIAEVAESTNDDASFEAYKVLLDRRPDDLDILRKMATLCERTGRLDDLWMTLDAQARVVEGDERAQILLRMGTLARNDLHNDERAVDAFARALEARPEDPGAVAGLAAVIREEGPARPRAAAALAPVYRASGAFEAYITCLEIQGAAAPTAEARKKLFLEITEVYDARLGRPERAFTWACRALHEDLADEAVHARIDAVAERSEQMSELAAFYLGELEDVRDPDLALDLRRRVAQIFDARLKDPARAIDAYNRVLDMAPGDVDALMALERLLPEVGEFGSLGDVYRRRIAQSADPEVRVPLLRQFAHLQAEQLDDQPGAITTLRRLLELTPDDVPALTKLAALCKGQNRTTELIETLERLVEIEGVDTTIGRDARVDLASAKAVAHGDLVAAEQLLRAVIAKSPDHPEARDILQERFEDAVAEDDVDVAHRMGELLSDALRANEAWPELISVLRVRAGLHNEDPHDRIALNREAAELYQDKLEEPALAFSSFAQVLQDAPGLEDIRAQLESLAEQLDLQEPLVDALEAARDNAAAPEVRADLDRRIAQLVTGYLHEPERAARCWQTVLAHSPDDPEALAALDPLFTDLGRWAGLTDILERRAELSDSDPDLQFDLQMRLGRIWDEWLSEPEEAIRWYQQARALRPTDPSMLSALSRLLDAESHPQALLEVLEGLAAQITDVPSRVRLWARMAKLVDERLERPEEAIRWWSEIRRVDPGHAEAVEALEKLFERTQQWSELADLLEAQITEAPDERTMLRLQRRLGLVRGTRLGSIDEAVQAWTEILKRNPNDVEALEALCQIYRGAERWDELVTTLRKLIPLQLEPADVKAIRFELAEVFLAHLNATDEAVESAKRVLDVAPHTVTELKRLEEIFVAAKAFSEAVKVMDARAAQAETRGQRIEILFDIARVYEEQIGRRSGAAAAYEQVLDLEPTSLKAYEALATAYETHGDYRKLAELYMRRLQVAEKTEERRQLLFSVIEIQERRLGQPELAFTVACRAFEEEGADPQTQRIAERLAEETDNWDVLAEVYEEQVDLVPAGRAAELRRRLAEIRLDRLEESDEAERQFKMVLAVEPSDEVARNRLIGLYQGQQRWSDLIEQLSERADLVGDIDTKTELLHEIARLHEAQGGDVDAAIEVLKRAVDFEPTDDHALTQLARIYRATEQWDDLLAI